MDETAPHADSPEHVVFVHGAWHGTSCWDQVRARLCTATSSAPQLPSSGMDVAALQDMYEDARVLREHVAAVRRAKPTTTVTVLAHSYGGIPMTEALMTDSGRPLAQRLIYLGASMLKVGDSLQSAAGGSVPWWRIDSGCGAVDPDYLEAAFYTDLPADVAQAAARRLCHQSYASFMQPLTRTAWRLIPSTYVVLDRDTTILTAAQEVMARRATHVRHLDSAHSPMLSQPRELAQLVDDIVRKTSRESGLPGACVHPYADDA